MTAPARADAQTHEGRTDVVAPVFIVGCGRSGTTMLFDLLAQHPDLVRTTGYPDGEDHAGWIEHGQCAMAGIGNVHSDHYGSGITGGGCCLHLTADDASPAVVDAMRRYYATTVLHDAPARRVLNKQPHLSNKLGYLLRIFPDARIVHVIRDCEPVVASWIDIMGEHPTLVAYLPDEPYPCFWLFPRPEEGPARSALGRDPRFSIRDGGAALWTEYWCRVNAGIDAQLAGREAQRRVVRYEDLVTSPTHTLAGLTAFCGLAPCDYEVGHLRPDTGTRHAHLLTPATRAAIARRAHRVREDFGYRTEAVA